MSGTPAPSTITLRALSGTPLEDTAIRGLVEATAHAVAERQGIEVLRITTTTSAITATLATGRIESIGFAAELRNLTNNWYESKHGVPLWGEKGE